MQNKVFWNMTQCLSVGADVSEKMTASIFKVQVVQSNYDDKLLKSKRTDFVRRLNRTYTQAKWPCNVL
jgi:hypothetical protein